MSKPEPPAQKGKLRRRSRADTLLIFDPTQKVPDAVLKAILEEWFVPSLVEQFVHEWLEAKIVEETANLP